MFRNRSFRTKLAVAIAPPLIVLVALVGTVVRPRLAEASDAAHKQDQAALAIANMQLRDELQIERDATIQKITSRPGSQIDTAAVRSATNARRVTLRGEIDAFSIRDAGERSAIAAAEQAMTSLDTLRSQIDTGTVGPLQIYENFEDLITLQVGISEMLVRGSNDTDLLRQAQADLSYMQYKNALARTNSFIGLRVESGTMTETDLLQISADLAVADEFRGQFLQVATPGAIAQEQAVVASPEFTAAVAMRDDILLAGARNRTPAVSPAAWWASADVQLAAIDNVENRTFGEFRSLADTKETEAQRDSTLYLAVLGIGVILAALAALAFGRSIASRLAKVSSDAHEIASERLPEVLEALRNPTPEVLANALPQVRSDSKDEIGSLAESFNIVLRTAVETSIAHSQRRADTLTNILVNLGRRNQSLIDRQLELVDELESTQRDPEVLRGLFQLDHMITSLRRNAENLLVLASDTQARSWSAPVPMVDVVRGAVAEVEDMSRISLELDLSDASMLTGRYAVDLSHLVAELVDNALAFSPPTTAVHIRSERTNQHLRVWILDSGLGMNESDLSGANLRVSNPPDVDELSADRIGFQVVGRLALRLGVSVRLQANPGGGIAASITVPVALLDVPEVPDETEDGFAVPAPPHTASISPAAVAASISPAPVAAIAELAVAEVAPEPVLTTRALPIAVEVEPAPPAPAIPAPVHAEITRSRAVIPQNGLPRRTWLDATPEELATTELPTPLTTSGLQRRVPGQAFVGDAKAQQFDSGQFRRLPMPGDRSNPLDDADVAEVAEGRLNALSGLQSGVGRARDESSPDEL